MTATTAPMPRLARGRHRKPRRLTRRQAAIARNTATMAVLAAIAAGFLLASPVRMPHQTPRCLRAQNCQCRELGGWRPGHNQCKDLPARAGRGHR